MDIGRCHRTRVAATATDRVREREDGYQWLHYTITVRRYIVYIYIYVYAYMRSETPTQTKSTGI